VPHHDQNNVALHGEKYEEVEGIDHRPRRPEFVKVDEASGSLGG
jgi:hypothetical protein